MTEIWTYLVLHWRHCISVQKVFIYICSVYNKSGNKSIKFRGTQKYVFCTNLCLQTQQIKNFLSNFSSVARGARQFSQRYRGASLNISCTIGQFSRQASHLIIYTFNRITMHRSVSTKWWCQSGDVKEEELAVFNEFLKKAYRMWLAKPCRGLQ